jgi:hypothetical protein
MDKDHTRTRHLPEPPESLDALDVFRGWRNVLFVIMVVSLVLLQISFWLVSTADIEIDGDPGGVSSYGPHENQKRIGQAAEQAMNKFGHSASLAPKATARMSPKLGHFTFELTYGSVAAVVSFVNAILVFASVLYVSTMFFGLIVSLAGKLGGLSHIAQAFYLSLVMLILLLPWQSVFGSVVLGAIYAPRELLRWSAVNSPGVMGSAVFYLRFTGYWALVVLLLVQGQLRSLRWTQTAYIRLRQAEYSFWHQIVIKPPVAFESRLGSCDVAPDGKASLLDNSEPCDSSGKIHRLSFERTAAKRIE